MVSIYSIIDNGFDLKFIKLKSFKENIKINITFREEIKKGRKKELKQSEDEKIQIKEIAIYIRIYEYREEK